MPEARCPGLAADPPGRPARSTQGPLLVPSGTTTVLPKVETFAYAVEEIAFTGMTTHQDRHYHGTRNQTSARLGEEYDGSTGELTGQWDLSGDHLPQ